MSVFHNNALIGSGAGAAAAAAAGPTRSLRFNDDDSAYLNRNTSSSGNRRTWTWSCWLKRSGLAVRQEIFAAGSDGTDFFFESNDQLQFYYYTSAYQGWCKTDSVFRDTSAWYHIVLVFDSTEGTASDRVKIYVNNVLQPLTFNNNFSQNVEADINNNSTPHYIGKYSNGNSQFGDYYLADVHFIDGSALDPTSFGSFDDSGVWQAAAYSGTFGTNGFHLFDFASESGIGSDSSGNNNDFTANNLIGVTLSGNYVANTYTTSGSTYDGTATGTSFYSGYPAADGFDGDTTDYVWAHNADQSWVYFRPSGGISGVTRLRIYSDLVNDIYVNGASAARTAGTGAQWYEITSPPSTLTEIAVQGTSGYVGRFSAIEINDSVLVEGTSTDTDVLFDVPTNGTQSDTGAGGEVSGNYATLNPLAKASHVSLSNGNLQAVNTAGTSQSRANATIAVSSGKWYFEGTVTGSSAYHEIGVITTDMATDRGIGFYSGGYAYNQATGEKFNNNGTASYGATYATGDVIGVALDLDNGTLVFYKNGVSQGTAFTGLSGTFTPAMGTYSSVGAFGWTANFGQMRFKYPMPSGYAALNTTALPAATIAKGSAQFAATLFTGNGGTKTISSLDFSPDWIWFKQRNTTRENHLYDSVRGPQKAIYTDLTNAEATDTDALSSFNSDGWTMGADGGSNQNNGTYVAWAWNAGANSNKTYTVKVVSDSGNKYRFDDFGTSAVTLDLAEGSTYIFDQSDSSNSGHPIRFGTSANGTDYTTGVTHTGTPGSAGAKTTLVLGTGVATLYYSCANHSGMGGQINTNSTAGASNFDGTIQSTVKANPEAGFSIVTATQGSGTSTWGHGLNVKPNLLIMKARNQNYDWYVSHSGLENQSTKFLRLNLTDGVATNANWFDSTEVTSSVVASKSGGMWSQNDTFVAYCFAAVEGFSSAGSWEANSSNDGPFVYTGFRSRFILMKHADISYNWLIWDTARSPENAMTRVLFPSDNAIEGEGTGYSLDVTSNGFKVRNTFYQNQTMIYFAFAENPFQANGGLAR